MKKRMKGFVLLLLLLCVQILFAAPCGDVNSSGGIDIVDALMTDPASSPTSTYSETIEAEDFEDLGGFYIGTLSGASGGYVICADSDGLWSLALSVIHPPDRRMG